MGQSLIKHINVDITLDTLITNLVTINVDIFNPLDAELRILFIQDDAKVDGTTFAHFDHQFEDFVIPPGQTVNSGPIDNVLLVQGAIASLGIIPLGKLDTFNAVTAQIGEGGYTIPWLQLMQMGVPTTYNLDILGISVGIPQFKSMASSMSASSVAKTATTASGTSSASGFASGPESSALVSVAVTSIVSSLGDTETQKSTSASSTPELQPTSTAQVGFFHST